jgi:hypothetical protein
MLILAASSCTIFTNKGAAAKVEEKGRAKIVNVEAQTKFNNAEKLENIAGLAYGTGYALSKVNDPPKEVGVAIDLNQRIVSLAGSPTIEKMKEMQEMIDKLTSLLATERKEGKQLLETKDLIITALQDETKALATAKEIEISKYIATAQNLAAAADGYKAELQEYQGWFGLKAVFKGLWQFIKSSMWILGIGSVLFLILRIVSMSNPIAASIFSIFNIFGSWMVNIIKLIFPKALELAGNTANHVFDAYKSTMWKLVDGIQTIKDRSKAAGKTPDLNEVLDEVSKTMNSDEKAIITEIKKALNWTQ